MGDPEVDALLGELVDVVAQRGDLPRLVGLERQQVLGADLTGFFRATTMPWLATSGSVRGRSWTISNARPQWARIHHGELKASGPPLSQGKPGSR